MTAPSDPLFSSNFAELLRRASNLFGDRTAMSHAGRPVSHADLWRRASAISELLRSAGLRAGDRCAILLKEPADAAAAFFATLAIGAVGINVNELYRPRQIEYVLGHSGAALFLSSAEILAQLPRAVHSGARVVEVDRAATAPGDAFDVIPASGDEAAQITYTSASTGQPKGVLMDHRALWAGVRIVASYLGLRADDRIASVLPFSFVYGFNQLTTALYTGATLVVERTTLAAEIVNTLRRERVTVLAAVPPLWQQLLAVSAFRDQPVDSLRILTCAGGRLPPAAVRELRRSQPQARLFLMYGLTEVFRSTYLPPEDVDAHPDSMGRAIPESTVYVARNDRELADVGEVGELVHGGPTMGIGYLGDDAATARVFRPNPFRQSGEPGPDRVVFSGDLVRRDESGLLYYVGRRDRMIKTLGFRVSPDEITDVVQLSGETKEAAVVTEPDAVRGERIVACVVLREGGDVQRLAKFCRLELPRHMQPARFVLLDEIPRTGSGKHDILTLTRQVTGEPAASGPAPSS